MIAKSKQEKRLIEQKNSDMKQKLLDLQQSNNDNEEKIQLLKKDFEHKTLYFQKRIEKIKNDTMKERQLAFDNEQKVISNYKEIRKKLFEKERMNNNH